VLLVLQELLVSNMTQNLQLVVQVAKEYTEQLGAGKIIALLEAHKSYHGLYYYLGAYMAFSEDPEVRVQPFPYCAGVGLVPAVVRPA
jgi:clathrin heavy chain